MHLPHALIRGVLTVTIFMVGPPAERAVAQSHEQPPKIVFGTEIPREDRISPDVMRLTLQALYQGKQTLEKAGWTVALKRTRFSHGNKKSFEIERPQPLMPDEAVLTMADLEVGQVGDHLVFNADFVAVGNDFPSVRFVSLQKTPLATLMGIVNLGAGHFASNGAYATVLIGLFDWFANLPVPGEIDRLVGNFDGTAIRMEIRAGTPMHWPVQLHLKAFQSNPYATATNAEAAKYTINPPANAASLDEDASYRYGQLEASASLGKGFDVVARVYAERVHAWADLLLSSPDDIERGTYQKFETIRIRRALSIGIRYAPKRSPR